MLADVTNPITNWIFPLRCVICDDDRARDPLCCQCRSMVTKASKSSLMLHHKKPALFFYEGIIKKLVVGAKFHRSLHHAAILMQLAERELLSSTTLKELTTFSPDCVSYVPTHWAKRLYRGVDLPQLFALLLARMLKVPIAPLLTRTKFFYHQSQHARRSERKVGILGAFALRPHRASSRLLLVDDIITTGATFDESKKMLKEMSKEIICLAIARTP